MKYIDNEYRGGSALWVRTCDLVSVDFVHHMRGAESWSDMHMETGSSSTRPDGAGLPRDSARSEASSREAALSARLVRSAAAATRGQHTRKACRTVV